MKIRSKDFTLEWKLMLGDMHSELVPLEPSEMETYHAEGDETRMVEIWSSHPYYGKNFEVRAEWTKNSRGLYSGRFSFRNYVGNPFVEEVHFPVLNAPHLAEQHLAFGGHGLGKDFEIPSGKPAASTVVLDRHQLLSLQFGALTSPKCSFYMDHRDAEHSIKYMKVVLNDHDRIEWSGIRLVGNREDPTADFALPYECTVGAYDGNWFDACRFYCDWALEQSWVQSLKARKNPLRHICMWVWNRGRIEEAIPPVMKLQQDLGSIPIALDWYWWHHNPYDTEVPELWPPREGVEKFRATIADLNRRGIFTQVYTASAGWDMDYPGWKPEYEHELVLNRDGNLRARVVNVYMGHRVGRVCGEAEVFHDKMSELTRNIRESGLGSIYLDVLGNGTECPCYNPSHRHDWGGGTYQVAGYRRLLNRLRTENPDFPMTTESCNEAYMDLVEGGIVCNASNERMGMANKYTIPLFTAVYHGLVALYGNYSMPDGIPSWDELWPQHPKWKKEEKWHKLYPDQAYIEMARPVIWGVQPMVCDLRDRIINDPEFADIYRFVLATAVFYHENLAFLFDGEMLSPEGFGCGVKRVEFMQRRIYTTPDKFKILRADHPAILHSVWQSPDGEKALLMANYTASEQAWEYRGRSGTLPPHSYLKVTL